MSLRALLLPSSFLLLAFSTIAATAPQDLSHFQIDPRLEISLFAAEPDVIDPIAIAFDEHGRAYVLEMRDYPYGFGPDRQPGGVIRLLLDTNHDGRADRSTTFATGLSYPTSIAVWNGGVLVTAPPEIIHLRDTNGDGVADQRESLFGGFVLGITDSNMSGLAWGLDNRFHVSNGGNGGTARFLKKNLPAVELGTADFSFDPFSGELSPTYPTSGGFGLAFDEFGRSFCTHNINHVLQRILPLAALNRFPGMLPVEATASISDHGDMARLYAISEAQTRPNHPEQAGHFSSSGGPNYIGYDAYPGDIAGSFTVSDVVANLRHRDLLKPDGPVFRAVRPTSEPDREFIASRDPANRPIALELGLDGALYLVDMQRDVIEHPDYIPEKMRKTQDIRAGDDRGRIYRIVPKGGLPPAGRSLAQMSEVELAAELEHRNQARRNTAQRLLIEKRAVGAAGKLRSVAQESAYAPARAQALWTLHGLGRLEEADLQRGLMDADPGVRENALQLIEPHSPKSQAFLDQLFKLPADPHPRVRFQLALTLGAIEDPRVAPALLEILRQDASRWTRYAALASWKNPSANLAAVWPALVKSDQAETLRDFADLAAVRSGRVRPILEQLRSTGPAHLVHAALEGLLNATRRSRSLADETGVAEILAVLETRGPSFRLPAWRLSRALKSPSSEAQRQALEMALRDAADANLDRTKRLEAIELLRLAEEAQARPTALAILAHSTDAEVQRRTFELIRQFRDPSVAAQLVAQWPGLSPALRPGVLSLLLSRKNFHEALVRGIENKALPLGELNLDLEQRRTLLRESSPDIQARAAKFIGDEEYSNRKTLVDEWLNRLPAAGDPALGRVTFERLCAQCHKAGALGMAVGPDLTSVSHRSVEDLLSNILDPNMAIQPQYLNFQAETKSGDLVSGLLERDTPQSVVFLQAQGLRATVPRSEILRLRSTGLSLMPEGVEAGLNPADLRNLIAFLQAPKP